ncbi:acyl-CoA dehydrogenase family protein [Aeromicrobium wangtongii]|uniref:Acyl-CoA/acyl-ACP dehydrogenase n=1 Tax=Aeromicrobium wangtongii TaxID=2969247 RepID=A0ABY5M831_9ACTN|nr:acyl-CoA dehydrogenase family protein [Aeromicrobium wangtongii]MCD9198688.1 acyl-CoA/acyl-ACP dehydrogenase [Aeromicrobium wangtongii]UUP13266.1 acyl-CoA/acyl-ACP dehydrogenase [Aeromicrobium wangtongii]
MLDTSPFEEPAERHDLRSMVQALLGRHLPQDRALQIDREGIFDRDVWQALGEAGVLGLGADEEAGGSGGTVGDALAVTEEIARVLPSLAVDYVTCGMAMRMLADANAGAAAAQLPDIASGRTVCAFGMSEPGVGTDLLSLRTTAREQDGQWVLNGQKTWISLGQEADVIFVVARTDAVQDGRKGRGLSIIAVPTDQPGVTTRRVHLGGMRAAITCEVFLDDAVAPLDHLVGTRGRAMSILGQTLDVERVLAAGISLGIGRAALDLHVQYAGEREAFGAPIGALQAVQHPAADSIAELTAARALVNTTVRMIEAGRSASEMSAMCKLTAGESTARIVDRGMRAMGAMGLAEESAMQMYFRDARLQLFSPVSNEMIRNILGEALGLPRSY